MRISMIGDEFSDINPNTHPTEYLVPLIHQRGFDDEDLENIPAFEPERNLPEQENGMSRDPFYSNTGVLLYLQYMRNYPMKQQAGNFSIRASLIYNRDPARDQYNKDCLWISERVPFTDILSQLPKNMFRIQDVVDVNSIDKNDTIVPLSKSHTWLKNFYNMLWNDNLSHDLVLFVEILENNNTYPSGVTVLKINNDDGTIKVGSYELPVYKYPLKDYSNPSEGQPLGYTISFMINEPKPSADQPQAPESIRPDLPESNREPEPRLNNFEPKEETKEIEPEDLGKKDNNKEAYIPNTLRQYDEKQYNPDEIIVLYVDSGRYLPENITVSRISMQAMNIEAQQVFKTISAFCLLEMSTCQKPYFGIREEFSRTKMPQLNDTTIFIFRIDAIDRNHQKQVVVGY